MIDEEEKTARTGPPETIYIVWNGAYSEGFVTDDANDAIHARSGRNPYMCSTVGNAFFELYGDDADDQPDGLLPMTIHALGAGDNATTPALKQYLVTYGADNDLWLCHADDADHAREQCEDANGPDCVNEIMLCTPA